MAYPETTGVYILVEVVVCLDINGCFKWMAVPVVWETAKWKQKNQAHNYYISRKAATYIIALVDLFCFHQIY